MQEITTILLNYKHPENIKKIIANLKLQTQESEIIVINNGEQIDFGVKTVFSEWNMGCYPRMLLASLCETEWTCLFDDDLIPKDFYFLKDALELAKDFPYITGAYGRNLTNSIHPYSGGVDAIGMVEIIKTRFALFRRSLLSQVKIGYYPTTMRFNDDIYLSLESGRGEKVHYASQELQDRLTELPTTYQLHNRPEHWQQRDDMVNWWKENN